VWFNDALDPSERICASCLDQSAQTPYMVAEQTACDVLLALPLVWLDRPTRKAVLPAAYFGAPFAAAHRTDGKSLPVDTVADYFCAVVV